MEGYGNRVNVKDKTDMRCLPAILPLKRPPPPLCRDAYRGAKVGSLRLKTRPELHLYLNRTPAGRGSLTQVTSGLSQVLFFSQLLAKLWTILVLRGHTRTAHRHPRLPAQLCLDSGVKDKRGSHKPQPRPTARRRGLRGLPHPSILHKALELTPSGLSAAQTMGTPVTQHRSS